MSVIRLHSYLVDKGPNDYLADLLGELVSELADPNKDKIDVMLEYKLTNHIQLEHYITIPTGIEGDHIVRDSIEALNMFISNMFSYNQPVLDMLVNAYQNNKRYDIYGGTHSVCIEMENL